MNPCPLRGQLNSCTLIRRSLDRVLRQHRLDRVAFDLSCWSRGSGLQKRSLSRDGLFVAECVGAILTTVKKLWSVTATLPQ